MSFCPTNFFQKAPSLRHSLLCNQMQTTGLLPTLSVKRKRSAMVTAMFLYTYFLIKESTKWDCRLNEAITIFIFIITIIEPDVHLPNHFIICSCAVSGRCLFWPIAGPVIRRQSEHRPPARSAHGPTGRPPLEGVCRAARLAALRQIVRTGDTTAANCRPCAENKGYPGRRGAAACK